MKGFPMLRNFSPRFLSVLAVVALGVSSLTFAGCQGHGRHGGDPHKKADRMVEKLRKKLELNDDQTAKTRAIAHALADKASEFRSLHGEVRKEALTQLRSATPDESALNRVAEDQEHKFTALRVFAVQKFSEFHAVLTPEQREKLADYLEKSRHRHGKRGKAEGKTE
jgi:Spy/CpxP family protein refolding chaperone